MRRISPVFLFACAALLAGCASSAEPLLNVAPLRGPKAEAVNTSYSEALRCLSRHIRSQSFAPPRVAVGLITDMTGAQDRENGRRLTQGATLMAITALSESGVRLVERFDMGVSQVEMDYARNGLLRDSDNVLREIRSGEVQGSDLYLVGGISEYNPNIRSRGLDGFGSGDSSRSAALTVGASDYVVDVAVDLRLVDTRSSEVLGVRSLRKQVVGREIRAGVFAFLDGTVVDIGGGQRAMEPVQTAVRAMVDQSVFEFVSSLYSFDTKTCLAPGRPVVGDSLGRGQFSPELEAATAPAALPVAPLAAPRAEGRPPQNDPKQNQTAISPSVAHTAAYQAGDDPSKTSSGSPPRSPAAGDASPRSNAGTAGTLRGSHAWPPTGRASNSAPRASDFLRGRS